VRVEGPDTEGEKSRQLRDNLSGQKTGGRCNDFNCPSSFYFMQSLRRIDSMKKKKPVKKIHSLKRSSEINLQITNKVCLIDLEALKEHEQVRPEYLEELKNEILSDGILKMPIAVDKATYIILDGHHRLHALRRIGCKRIPCILFDYQSAEIEVLPQREGETVTKEMIIETALTGRRMPPKTSKHMVMIEGELKHISILESVINIPLEKLK
jgi:hypothetical protein